MDAHRFLETLSMEWRAWIDLEDPTFSCNISAWAWPPERNGATPRGADVPSSSSSGIVVRADPELYADVGELGHDEQSDIWNGAMFVVTTSSSSYLIGQLLVNMVVNRQHSRQMYPKIWIAGRARR